MTDVAAEGATLSASKWRRSVSAELRGCCLVKCGASVVAIASVSKHRRSDRDAKCGTQRKEQ